MPRFYAAERGFDRWPSRVIAQQRPGLARGAGESIDSSTPAFVPALSIASPCFRGALRLPRRVLYLHLTPHEGWMERRQAHSGLLCRACEARRSALAITRAVPLQPGRPLGAPPWRFSAGDPCCRLRQWGTGADQRLACARPYGPAGGIPDLPRQRFAPPPQDATPRSACRIVSGDAPHERGCESM